MFASKLIISLSTFILIIFNIGQTVSTLVKSSASSANIETSESELMQIEQKLEQLKHEESRLLHQMRTKLIERAIESAEINSSIDDDDDGFVSILSRARRTADAKVRWCGAKIGKAVKTLCPDGCKVDEFRSKRSLIGFNKRGGLATRCCENKCSLAEIQNSCCPPTSEAKRSN